MEDGNKDFFALRRAYIERFFGRLNPSQRDAVLTTKGPVLILAGAGSGKTTVLVNRIANLIRFGDAYHTDETARAVRDSDVSALQTALDTGDLNLPADLRAVMQVDAVRPWNILAITFTNKAAGELKSRIQGLLGEDVGRDVNASTFHSACVRILRRHADVLGYPTSFTIYDADDQLRVLKEIFKSRNIDDKFIAPRAAAAEMGRLKDKMLTPKEAAEAAENARAQLLAEIYAAYAKRCKQNGAMDFDDLIYHTVCLLRDHADVREDYRARFKYILVDEYQDTSTAQSRLVGLLCGEANNICVVGDDDQSIYRFRGATIENILGFETAYPGAKVIRLEENYRSTSNILDAANSVIRQNTARKGKTLRTGTGEGKLVHHYIAENEMGEAAHIAEVIERHLEAGDRLSDHAVLYRMNAQSSTIENFFTRAGIPHKIVGGQRFNDRKEVKDIHAYMSVVASPRDDLRLRRIINEPGRRIGDATMDKVAEIAAGLGVPMLEVVRDAGNYEPLARAAAALAGFYAIYEKLVVAEVELDLADFAAAVPDITGYNAMLEAQGEEGKTRLENIGQLVSNVKTYVDMNGAEASLEGYLEEIALIADIDSMDEEADKVVLMTLHSSKGLEFPYVFIVGLEEGIFPSDRSRFEISELEEERRLCYVGITRAERELYLSSAASRMLYGQTRRNQPSRFTEEIDPNVLEVEEAPGASMFNRSAYGQFDGFGDGARAADAVAGDGFGKVTAGAPFARGGPGAGGSASGVNAGFGSRGNTGYLDRNYNRGEGRAAGGLGGARDGANSRPKSSWRENSALAAAAAKPAPKAAGVGGEGFAPGDKVKHKIFGVGVVRGVTKMSNDSMLEIAFEKVGVKKTMANFAPLEKL